MKIFLLYFSLVSYILFCSAEIGFLQVSPNRVSDPVNFCVAYNKDVNSLPTEKQTLVWNDWHETLDIYPSNECNQTNRDYKGKYVFVKRGNCTFTTKTINVQQANGRGILVVSDKGLDTPGVDTDTDALINITLAVITKTSYQEILDLQKRSGVTSVRVSVYAPVLQSVPFDPSSVVMWLIAVFTLAYGAWCQGALQQKSNSASSLDSSVPRPSSKANVVKNANMNEQNISESTKTSSSIFDFTVTPKVSLVFFVMCSVSLLLMYFFYDYLVYIIIAMFCYASSLSLFEFLSSFCEQSACFKRPRLPPNKIPLLSSRPSYCSVALYLSCVGFAVVWVIFRKESFAWILQDVLGFSFCVLLMKTIKISSFRVSTLLLMLFFVYDVFYVFITPLLTKDSVSIMVEVATGASSKTEEELPMLFKLPKFINFPLSQCLSRDYTLLGFGDIILPGLHVGFCAIWDVTKNQSKTVKSYVYYISSVMGYALGLVITFIAVYTTKMGQPALLYLAPCCILSTLFVALKQKELSYVWYGQYKPPEPPAEIQPGESHSLLEVTQQT